MKSKIYSVRTIFPIQKESLMTVSVPGSKSITNRALLLAALANKTSILRGVLFSEDTRHFIQCLLSLGFPIQIKEDSFEVSVSGFSGRIPKKKASVYVGSAGTAARFLTALLGLSDGNYYLDASPQMKKRPMAPLLQALTELGSEITFDEKEGFFPFFIHLSHLLKNDITIDIKHSSQFLSALLMSAPLVPNGLHLHIAGTHGLSYIQLTAKMMAQFGCFVSSPSPGEYHILPGKIYQSQDYSIEPDVSAACYFYAMAPLLGIRIQVKQVRLDSMQGDIRFLHILEKMGCILQDTPLGLTVTGPKDGNYPGVTVDLGDCSDQTMTLAALAVFASSPTTITNISHIKYQESNRIQAIMTELTKLGISCLEQETGITIYPGKPKPSVVETYEDHRMAMAFSLIGLRAEGIQISNPDCCRKTFEGYFSVLDSLIDSIQKNESV